MEEKKKKPNRLLIFTVVVLIILSVYIIAWIPEAIKDDKMEAAYNEALEKMDAEDYKEAQKLFGELKKEHYSSDCYWLELYCMYRQNNYDSDFECYCAYSALEDYSFNSLNEERREKVESFMEEIKTGYDSYRKAETEKSTKEYEKKRKEEEREAKKVPWIGMPESQIASTSLGAPSGTVRHNTDKVDGKYITCNLYDFYDNHGHYIFCARCGNGRVINISDYRDDPSQWDWDPNYKGLSRFDYIDDVDDYVDPDDFYYDHYDDFYDYEEAEDFYYSHGGR